MTASDKSSLPNSATGDWPPSRANPPNKYGVPPSKYGDPPNKYGEWTNYEKTERYRPSFHETIWTAAAAAFPWKVCLRTVLGATVALYILNQKHLLPKPLSSVVSKVLFWPTLPITVGLRLGKWMTLVDDTVVMGGAPFGFANVPERLYKEFGVRGVINLCQEYRGPTAKYARLGMIHLHLPTVDHFEPTVEDLERAVKFIRKREANGERVYVHCRAGHGRSAAAVLAWLLYKFPHADPKALNDHLCSLRNVRKTLWQQDNIRDFHERLLHDLDKDEDNDSPYNGDVFEGEF